MGSLKCFGLLIFLFYKLAVIPKCHAGSIPLTPTTDVDTTWTTISYWPGGIIPYLMPVSMYEERERGLILAAMRRWEYKTCVKFVPWTENLRQELGGVRYINFFSAGSCFSRAGMEEYQPQLFGIGRGCLQMTTIVHELGHTIGLVHEMERVDRDLYIDIRYENMNEDSIRNFATTESKNQVYPLYNTPYDYKSIMHYGPKVWSKNDQPVMVTKDPAYQLVIGQADDVSFYDALYVNRAYNCSDRCSEVLQYVCHNGGFLGGPDCRCICQDGYMGEFCDTPIPGNEYIVEWKCQDGWVYSDGKCYLFNAESQVSFNLAKFSCLMAKANLVVLKGRPEQVWLNHLVAENRLVNGVGLFWIGLTKPAGVTLPTWLDGSFVDTNLISLVNDVHSNRTRCAKFDGETATLTDCSETNSFICEKDFDTACGGRYTISGGAVAVQSPGYPNGYPENIECTYVLQAGSGSRMKIDFEEFQLDSPNKNDFLEVKLKNNATLAGTRYKGSSLDGVKLESEGNLAILTFKSDGRIAGSGFKAVVTEIVRSSREENEMPILTAIRNVLGWDHDANSTSRRWRISELYDLVRSMTFSDVLK